MNNDQVPAENLRHLLWIPATALVGFAAAFVFADLLVLPRDFYYFLYFACVVTWVSFYASRTRLGTLRLLKTGLTRGVILGIVFGVVLARGVLAHPGTPHPAGPAFWWVLFWRGLVYGFIDGLLLLSLPWTIVWRAFDADRGLIGRRIVAAVVAWTAVLVVTTAYHLGYQEFRSAKILQPNIGSAIGSLATLAAANPVASPIAHVFMHVTAVIHSPETDLYLPPHRRE